MKISEKVSVVIPCYKSEQTIGMVVDSIASVLNKEQALFEIILVNDSSPDGTWNALVNCWKRYPEHVVCINLAKNFGQQGALMAGMHYVSGEKVVFMDDDGQTDPNFLPALLASLDEKCDLVFAQYPEKKHTWFRNAGSKLNNWMAEKLIGKPADINFSSYFVCRRYVVDSMLQYRNPYPYVAGLAIQATSRIGGIEIPHHDRMSGQSGYNLRKLFHLWLNGFTSFSVKPLRVATTSGAALAAFGFLYAVYTVINKIINPAVPAGWSSLICAMMIIGGMMMVMLGLVGEYVGRIYISLNNAPQYVVREMCGKHDDPASQQNGYNC